MHLCSHQPWPMHLPPLVIRHNGPSVLIISLNDTPSAYLVINVLLSAAAAKGDLPHVVLLWGMASARGINIMRPDQEVRVLPVFGAHLLVVPPLGTFDLTKYMVCLRAVCYRATTRCTTRRWRRARRWRASSCRRRAGCWDLGCRYWHFSTPMVRHPSHV